MRVTTDQRTNGYGHSIKARREAMGISGRELARLAGIAYSTLKEIEAGRSEGRPRTRTDLDRILAERPVTPPTTAGAVIKFAAHYSPMADLAAMQALFKGAGGEIEPRMLYAGPEGAAGWLTLCRDGKYSKFYREGLPVREAARLVVEAFGAVPLRLVGLGSGDGASEIRLVQALQDRRGHKDLSLQLLDFSPFLLKGALDDAQDLLPHMELTGMLADFWRLPDIAPAVMPPGTAGIFAMFGGTVGNSINERRLFETIATCARPGDFLLFDLAFCEAPANEPEAIRQRDHAFLRPLPEAMRHWMSLPLLLHGPRGAEIEVVAELGPPAVAPGSYEIRVVAYAREPSQVRKFLLTRSKRYDPELLMADLRPLGWDPVECLRFLSRHPTDALMVCRRR